MANRMPHVGRSRLTPMLNAKGKLIGDFTVARVSADRFLFSAAAPAEHYHMRWFESHLPDSGVAIRSLRSDAHRACRSPGPSSRELLASLAREDVSTEAFPFMIYRRWTSA